jgi:hypothetical protein
MNKNFEEYQNLMAKMLKSNVSVYIESEMKAFNALCEKIAAIEKNFPEFEEMLENCTE